MTISPPPAPSHPCKTVYLENGTSRYINKHFSFTSKNIIHPTEQEKN